MGLKSGGSSPQVYHGKEVNLLLALWVRDGSKVAYPGSQMLDTSDGQSKMISSLTSEADAALMFTSMASFERSPAARAEYLKNARRRYDTVLRYVQRAPLSANDQKALGGQLAAIKAKLEALGERF
jgi:hypothetical protein